MDCANDDDRNEHCDQSIFDSRCPGFVSVELSDNSRHFDPGFVERAKTSDNASSPCCSLRMDTTGLASELTEQLKRDRLDGVNVLTVEKEQIKGRHSDQCDRRHANHGIMIGAAY